MTLKIEFVERATRGEKVSKLCREYGITRAAGYKWLKRFKERGYEGLEEKSRRPKNTPLATAEDIVVAVLEARESHPTWGPRKLVVLLRRKLRDDSPSERTIARILKRAKKVRERRKRRPTNVVELAPRIEAKHANDVWTVDFKGWWRARNGERCDPLTIRDAFSRFILAIVVCPSTIQAVRAVFERLFRKYGVPNAIQCDNGEPFVCVTSRGGLSRLSAWWLSLGIRLVRSRPGCPQDNGGHERMHADISAEIETEPSASAESEQRRLDRWRQVFNHVRPHDALGGTTPAEAYKVEVRRPFKAVKYIYASHLSLRRVSSNGRIAFKEETYFLSQPLAGFDVAIEVTDALHLRAWYRDLDLGLIEIVPDADDASFDLSTKRAHEQLRRRSRAG